MKEKKKVSTIFNSFLYNYIDFMNDLTKRISLRIKKNRSLVIASYYIILGVVFAYIFFPMLVNWIVGLPAPTDVKISGEIDTWINFTAITLARHSVP